MKLRHAMLGPYRVDWIDAGPGERFHIVEPLLFIPVYSTPDGSFVGRPHRTGSSGGRS